MSDPIYYSVVTEHIDDSGELQRRTVIRTAHPGRALSTGQRELQAGARYVVVVVRPFDVFFVVSVRPHAGDDPGGPWEVRTGCGRGTAYDSFATEHYPSRRAALRAAARVLQLALLEE